MRNLARILAIIVVCLAAFPLERTVWAAPAEHPLWRQVEPDAITAQIAELTDQAPSIADRFRQDDGRWDVESTDSIERSYGLGLYRLTVLAPQTIGWSLAELTAANFYLEVDAFHVDGPLDNEFGVVFRYVDADNFYLFGASSDGYYTLQKVLDGEWVDLVAWTMSDEVQTGEQSVNTLGILADEERISVLINGVVLATVEDSSFSDGQLGLVAGTFDKEGAAVAFDDLLLWDLDESSSPEPTVEPTIEPTVEPTIEPTIEPAPTPDLAAVTEQLTTIRETEPLLSDDFRRDEGLWPVLSDENVTYSFAERAYHQLIQTENWLGFAFNTEIEAEALPNFLAEVDVAHVSGPVDAEYGLLFHYQDGDNFYLYAISGMGTYSLWKKVDAEWQSLIDWTASEALESGEEPLNRLGLLVQDGLIILLANDTLITQFAEEPAFTGTVGLVAGAFNEPDVEIAFDNFDLWAIEGAEPEPTETPEQTEKPESTETPEPTATPEPVDVSAQLADIRNQDPTFADDFRLDEGDWATGSDEDSETLVARRTLHINVLNDGWLAWTFAQSVDDLAVADFLAEVDVERIAGPANAEYGLVFRFVDDENFYLFAISGLGSYSLAKKVDNEWQDVIPWTESDALYSEDDAINRLSVLAEGSRITLLVNDVSVAQVEDESHLAGSVGLAAGTFDEGELEASFDNFDLWVLGAATIETATATATPVADAFDAEAIAEDLAAIRQADPVYTDDFRRDTGVWEQPDYEAVLFEFARGAYRLTVAAPNVTPGSPGDIEVTDFLLEVDAAQIDGPDGQYGVYFRQQDESNFYMFVVSPLQSFALWRMDEGEWTELLPWTNSDAILAGQDEVNRLGVLSQGSQITLLVNDTPVAQVEDETFSSGRIALAAGTFDESGVVAEFDNLSVWDAP